MWLMLQQDQGDDYVMATNDTNSVKDFVIETFNLLGLDWEKYVGYDKRYERPTEVDLLIGDPAKAEAAWLGAKGGLQGVGEDYGRC